MSDCDVGCNWDVFEDNLCLACIDQEWYGVVLEFVVFFIAIGGLAHSADHLCNSLETLCDHWHVPEDVGGATFMAFVLICLILGLALSIERIIYLNMATTNTGKLLEGIEGALGKGVDAAKEVCRETRGPVASIFYQGLDRSSGSYEEVAKAIEDYGSVEMSKPERGLSWISLFIALAPMLGFMGTVIGMIEAFDKIAQANTINASIVAGGIKVALITTVSGLVVAIILQIFYNYILSKIDGIVFDMEEASMDLVDLVYRNKLNG